MNTHPNLRRKVRKLGLILLPYALLAAFLFTTNPQNLPAALLLVPFLLLFWCLFSTIYYGFGLLGLAQVVTPRKRLVLAFCLALLPTILLILQSINQLTGRDTLIFSVFIAVLALYVGRANFKKR